MSPLANAFAGFLSPIQYLFRVLCWAPSCQLFDKQTYTSVVCIYLTFTHFIFAIVAIFQFHTLNLPDDFTNQAVIILIELAYTVIMVESFVKQNNFSQIINYFIEFDQVFVNAVPQINLYRIYHIWKGLYYQQVFGRFVIFSVGHLSGSLIYFYRRGLKVTLVGIFVAVAKIGIYTKTIQIAFYVDMVRERLKLLRQAVLHSQIQEATIMYAILYDIYAELNTSVGMSLIALYLQSLIDLVNVSHIMYWNVVVEYTHMGTIGVCVFAGTIVMPLWELVIACKRCQKIVIKVNLLHLKKLNNIVYFLDTRNYVLSVYAHIRNKKTCQSIAN